MSNNVDEIDKAYRKAREKDGSLVYKAKKDSWLGRMTKKHRDASGKERRMKAFREEARRKVSLANKRIRRLEEQGLTDSPAYQALVKSGNIRFSVKGKDYNETQALVSEMDRFIAAKTSTVRGIVNHTKSLAKITNFKYDNVKQLKASLNVFFRLHSAIEQYLRTVHDMASAIGYQKIWESINTYVEQNKIDLSEGEQAIEEMITNISKAIVEQETPEHILSNRGADGQQAEGWFKLLD